MKFLLTTVFVLLAKVTSAQELTLAKDFLNQAEDFLTVSQFDSTRYHATKAAEIYKPNEDWKNYIECLNLISESYWRQGRLREAIDEAWLSIDVCNQKLASGTEVESKAYKNLGVAYDISGEYDSALMYLEKSKSILLLIYNSQHVLVGTLNANIGIVYYSIGDYYRSLRYMRQALDAYRKNISSYRDSLNITSMYHNIGILHQDFGNYDSALYYTNLALIKYKEYDLKNNDFLSRIYNTTGAVHSIYGQNNLALEYYKKSYELDKQLYGNSNLDIARSLQNIGLVYSALGEYEKAKTSLKKAQEIKFQIVGPKAVTIGNSYRDFGHMYAQSLEFDLAIENYDRAIDIYQNSIAYEKLDIAVCLNGIGAMLEQQGKNDEALEKYVEALTIENSLFKKHPDIALSHNKIAQIFLKKSDYTRALEHFQKALVANITDFDNPDVQTNPALDNTLDQLLLLSSLSGKGRALEELFDSTKDILTLRSAFNTYLICDSLTSKIRNSILKDSDKEIINELANQTYEGGISVNLKLFKATDELNYKKMAFYYSERNKAMILSQGLTTHTARRFGGIGDSLISEEKALLIYRDYLHSKIRDEELSDEPPKIPANYQADLFTVNRSIDSLVSVFEQEYPKYYELKYNNKTISIDRLQKSLGASSALIEYYIGSKSTYVFLVTKSIFDVFIIETDDSLSNKVINFKNLVMGQDRTVRNQNITNYAKSSYSLYSTYLLPSILVLPESINKLVFVPDGELAYIPFDLLLTDESIAADASFKELPYLLHEFQTTYDYSASIKYIHNDTKKSSTLRLVAFAPEYRMNSSISSDLVNLTDVTRSLMMPLEYNQIEAKLISQHIPGDIYTQSEATEKSFKRVSSNYDIIHLAQHAFTDSQDPMKSKLAFSHDIDSLEDNFLYAYELYNLELNSDLVVLSACNTGVGKLLQGEGVMSLARAFSYAGCPSVVMSHWSVNDVTTSQLMDLFYKHLAKGLDKDEALQKAKIDYLETSQNLLSSPYYWGAFVVTGDTSALISTKYNIFNSKFSALLIIFIFIFFGTITYYLRYVYQRTKTVSDN